MNLKGKKGITILALSVTIIILLILAGISISMLTGDNGLIRNAVSAKEQAEIDGEKEILEQSVVIAMGKDKYGNIEKDKLDKELDKNLGENNHTSEKVDEGIEVTINNKRIYLIDKDGNVTEFAGIKLSNKELLLSIVNGNIPEYTITASKFNITEDINWESSDITVATVENGKVIAVDSGKTIITAKCTSNGKEYIANCEVEVAKHIDYSYVQYDVEYKDVYTGTQYTKNTGWRLLNQKNNENGTYDIEIISTGIPAKLYYYGYDDIKKFENDGTIGKWAGNVTQRSEFVDKYYGTVSYNNVYAAAGLFYNFENIVFNVTGTTNTLSSAEIGKEYGGYIEIKNGQTTVVASDTTTGKDLFRANIASGTITGIRSVNLEDITGKNDASVLSIAEEKLGLFKLQQYTPDIHNTTNYWLASPYYSGYDRYLYYVGGDGVMRREDGYNYGPYGVRPVISISGVKMIQEEGSYVWKITE